MIISRHFFKFSCVVPVNISRISWINQHGGRPAIYFTFNYCIWRIVLLYILCDDVCVKRVILISIAMEWNIQSLAQCSEMSCVSIPFWRIGDIVSIMIHLLAYTCMILTSAKTHVHMTVCSIEVTLIPLVHVENVSRS